MRIFRCLILISMVFLILSFCSSDNGGGLKSMRGVFVGASITEAWDFNHYFSGYDFKKVIHYDWKKSDVWDEIENHDPDIVVVKECAAYFYTDGNTPLNEYYTEMENMVALIKGAGSVPVLATTIPVDVGQGDCTKAQLDDIIEFNNWVRNYCSNHSITCMDYYEQIADNDGELPTDCHDGDGLHPNSHGYDILSQIVIPTLEACIK